MKNLLIVLIVLFVCAFSNAGATNYYFSTNSGNDLRTSLQAQNPSTPWKTLTKFNAVFASLQPGDSVLFKRSETFYGSMTISQSGTSALPIVIGAYGVGTKPVVSGFIDISGWTALGGGVYENNCSSCPTDLNMVTINDTLQPIGRYPKADDPNGGYWSILSHDASSIFSYDLLGRTSFVGGEVVMRKLGWIMDRAVITGQGPYSLTYTPLPSPQHPGFTYEVIDGNGFFIQNHPATFTKAGDWSYDKTTKKLRIYQIGNGIVKASAVETLVDISSRSYINFDNLAFTGSNANTFNIVTSNYIQINNCDINFSGIEAIYVNNNLTNNITVNNCTILNTNNNAINGNNSSNWVITNNIIRNTAINKGMGQSGDGQYNAICYIDSRSIVEYNVIKKSGYHGIQFTGDDILIKNNLIDSFSLSKSDGGGIYNNAETTRRNRKVIGNIVLNGIGDRFGRGEEAAQNPFAGNVHGIYLDGGATHVEISGNTVAHCTSSGMELSSSSNVQATNNTIFDNTMTQIVYFNYLTPITNLTVKNNILFAKRSDQLISLINSNSNSMSTWGVIDSNYYCRPISEPVGVDTSGYSHQPSLFDYPDGGIIQAHNYRFLSLDKWQTLSNQDANTKKTQAVNIDPNNVRFEYNATNANKIVALDGSYRDVKNNLFTNSVTLAPYSSIILMKTLPGFETPEFNVYKAGFEADLKWTSGSAKQHTEYFEIERSPDGINFSIIDKIYSNDVSQNSNRYFYRDRNPLVGNNFYRLKAVSLNGDVKYNKTARVFFENKINFEISPNPVHNLVKIVFAKGQGQRLQNGILSVQTLTGKIVKSVPVTSTSDITIDLANFPNATYIISFVYDEFVLSKKIVKSSW